MLLNPNRHRHDPVDDLESFVHVLHYLVCCFRRPVFLPLTLYHGALQVLNFVQNSTRPERLELLLDDIQDTFGPNNHGSGTPNGRGKKFYLCDIGATLTSQTLSNNIPHPALNKALAKARALFAGFYYPELKQLKLARHRLWDDPLDPHIDAYIAAKVDAGLAACTHSALIDALSGPLSEKAAWPEDDAASYQFTSSALRPPVIPVSSDSSGRSGDQKRKVDGTPTQERDPKRPKVN